MASNENQDKLQVTIEPVLDPNAATNVTEELKQRVTSGQAYIDEMKQYYTDKAGGTSAYDIFIAPLEKFSTELISIADSLNKGLDTSKLGVLQQKLTGISRMVGELDEVKGKQTAAASLIDKNTMSALSQFTAELQRVMPNARTIDSIMGSDLGKRMMSIVSGGKATTAQDYGTVKRYLTMAMPSLHPVSGFRDESQKNIHNVSDYLPMMFMSAQMDTKSLQGSFSNVTKKAIAANLKEQIAAITTIPEANRTKEQTAVLKQLTHQNQFTTKANHNPVLNAEFTKEIIREFENNNRFAKVLIDTGIAAKGTDEGTYQLPAQFTRRMLGTIAAGLQKAYIASTAGYNSPDLDKVVSNPFKYNTDTKALEGMTPEQRGFARLIVARGGYEGAQGIIQGMDLIQKIKNNGVDSFILPGENNSWGREVRTPNISRDLLRYQKYNVGSNGLQEGGTVLYQESEATRFLNRYGGNQLQRTTKTKGGITPGIVVVDANSFDFNNDEKAREHFGNLAYGMDTPNGHYSFATMHRGDEGQHVTLIRDDIREKAVGEWRREQSQNYQRNANTNALWQRGEAVAKGSKLSYEAIQKLNPYDRAAYQIYASTTFASPLTAYSQIGVEDMPDNAKRAKTEDALNKIYSPSIEQVGKIGEAAKKGLDKGLKLHYVRDEDAVSILSGVGGGLINNNGAVYMSSDILPYDMQMRGLWGALKGMGISIQADKNGDIYSALQQAGMLDQDGRLMIGGRDISHGLGIVTESSLKSPDLKDALLSIEQAADENGMVPGADGKLVPYQDLMSDVLTQFALSGEISSIARVIDKKNESGKIGAQFMSHLIPTAQMVRHQRDTWKELDELANDPDKALAAVFPSDKGDATSRELHRLKKERDENPDNPLAARAFAQAMQNSSVQGRIRNFIESRKREMTAGNYFDIGKIDKDSRITQGFLGTSFIQRVLTAARASEENKDLSNVEVVQKTNAQLFKDAMNVADWKGVGLDGLSDEQKQKVAANALLMENMFAGFTEEELKELKDKNLLPADLEDNGFVFDPQSEEFKLGYHRDPSTKKDVMTRYNGAQLLRGLEKVKGKAFEGSDGKKHNRPYESMFRNTIAVNPNDWEYLASADEDGDTVKRFSGLYYSLLKSDVDANAKMQEAALKYYSDKFADVQVRPVEGETPENAKANLIERMSRSLVSRAKMAQFSGQDSRVAQLGLTAEMLADPNNTTALAFYKGMMRSAQLYDYATTYEKKPLDILLTNEDFKATALGAEYGKGVNAVTEALNLGAEKYKEGKRQLLNDENADENATVQDYIGDNYYVGKGGMTLDKSKMGRIDQFNLPSAFQANILTSILSRSGSQYNVDEEQTLRDYLVNDEEHGLGFENAIGEAEKNYLKAKRGFFVDYYTGKRTGAISDEEMEEFHKLQLLAEEEREKYIEEHRTGNPDTMKVNGEVVKISKWAKDHNRAIGYTQGRNIDLFGMTNANIAKALSEGMYFENDAIAELTNLWTGAKAEQAQTLAPIENPKATNKSLAKASTPKKTTKKAPAKKKTKTATATTPSTTPAPAPTPAPVLPQPEPAQVATGGLGSGQVPNMYTKVDGYQLLKYAQNLEAQGKADEAEAFYEQAEDIIRATTVSGHTMSTLAGQDQFNTPIMAYGRLFGINSPEDAGTTSALRKNAGDMMESIVLNHLNGKSKKYHFVDPLDVFGIEDERKLTGEARVEADKKLRRKMAFNYFTPGQKYNGLTIAGNTNPAIENKENLRGMWDSLMVDENGNVRTVLEMKTMGLHRFQDMVEGRNTDRRYFDEHGVPYTYKIQGAGYAHAAGLDSYAVAMTGLTEKDRRELDKAKKNPNYVPQISPLSDDNFHVQEYKVSDLEIPDVDKNGNFIYEENDKGEKQLKMLRGVEALHALQSRNEQMLNGELAPDGLMHTNNRLLGARQAMIANRLRERDIVNVKDFIPTSSPDELAALASSPTSALAIANGDAGALITEILGKVSGMPMELEQRQAVGEIGKNLLSEANNFNANMRKEIFKNRDASSSQSFMSSTQAQIENATNMLNTLKSDESIKKILSEQPNTQGAELLSSMLKTLETSVGNMVDNRISAAIAKGTHDVENAQKTFEETIKGKDGTENQRKSFEDSQQKMKNLTDMAELLEASADEDGLTKESRESIKAGAENLQKQIDELTPLYQQANAMTTKNGIDAIDEMIGKQIQSPQEAAEKKIQELVKKAYGQGGLLLDMFKQGGLTEESFKENMSRLFGTGWEGLSDEDRSKLLSGDAKIEDLLGAGTGGLMGTIQGQYRDELFGKIASGRQARLRNANKTLRTNEARLTKKSMTPEELAEENRYLEQERIRDSLEQYRNTFGLSKDPEEQEQYINLVHRLLGDNADEMLAERVISGQASDEELAGLGGQYGMIDNYVEQMLRESKQKTARSVRQMNRAARRSSLAIDRKVATPEELAQEMREDKEWGIRDALSNARDKLSGVDDNALVELAKSYLGDDITRDGLNRFLDGSMTDEELAGLGGQYGSLGDYQRAMLMQQTRQKRMREMSMNRRDRSLRRTMAGKGMSPEEQAQIATEDMEQQMRENLEQRMTTFGANSPQFQRAIQSTLGEKATQEDAMAFLNGTATPEQMAAWGGDYAMLGNYGNYIQDRALMQREGAEMSLDQLMSEKRLMKMQQSPFANTWGMRMMMQGIQQAQKERNLNFRIRQARQQLRMLDGESLIGTGSAKPQPETAASAEARREEEKPKMSLGEAIANLPTEADDAYTGVVFKGKDASGLSKNQQAQLAVVDGFAKRVGVQVGIHDTLRAPDGGAINGMFDPKTNKIDLALDAEGNLITRTMGHEMMHYIRNNSEDDYKELMAFTKSTLQNTPGYDYEARVQEKLAQYNNGLPENQWITRDQAEEEIGAEAMIDMLNGKDVMNDLQKQKGSLGNAVSGRLGDYADALHEEGSSLNNPEAQAMAAQSAQTVETLRAKFMQASMNASRKRQEAMGPNQRRRYSRVDAQNTPLAVMRNMSAEQLKDTLRRGTMAGASVAITSPKTGYANFYGTSTLMMPSDFANPEMNKEAQLFSGNAWTGNFPSYSNIKDKTQKMMGEEGAKYRFSRRDDEPRKKQRPEWMNDKSNPFVYGDSIAVQYAKRDNETGKYSTDIKFVPWQEASKQKLLNAKNRSVFKEADDFEQTGRFVKAKDVADVSEIEARINAKKAETAAKARAEENAERAKQNYEKRIRSQLEGAQDDKERKTIAKRAIRELKEEQKNYKINKRAGKYPELTVGKNKELVAQELGALKAENQRSSNFDQSAITDAENAKEKYITNRANGRGKIEKRDFPDSEFFDKKKEEIDQRRRANEDKRTSARAEANARADARIAQNKRDLETLQRNEKDHLETEYNKRESAIKQAVEKATAKKREKIGANQKEEAELRAEKADMGKRYGKKVFDSLARKTKYKNNQEKTDALRLKQINRRLAAIGEENIKLQDEINPSSKNYEDFVTNLPEVKAAKDEYQTSIDKRKSQMFYLQDQANAEAEKERKKALSKADADYRKEKDDIDKESVELGKSYDMHTKQGREAKEAELKAFDEETKVGIAAQDKAIEEAKKQKAKNDAERYEKEKELEFQRIYDPDNSKNGVFLVDRAYQGRLEEQNRTDWITTLQDIAKTGKMPQDEEDVGETTTAATGAVEQATNAVSALGDAAQQAAAKLNETAEDDDSSGGDSSGGDSSGGDSSGGDSSGGDEEPAPAPPSNPPTPPAPPSDTGAPDDPNYRTTRWGRRVQRRFHEDGTRYSDEEETRQDGRETRATAAAAFKDISKSAINMGSRAITNFGRSVFNSAINEAKNFVRQYDALMNEIQTITMKTGDEMSVIATETVQQALELKASVTDVATIKADLYRQGLSDDEVNERMEQVVQFSKVTGIKASESVQIVTTAMNTGLADSAQQAMDVLTALGDAAATTADQIQKGIQKAGSSAKVAGVSYEELATMMTIGTSNTQLSGQQIGTALQTIFARMNKVTQSNYISDLEGGTTSLNDVESALGIVGVELRDDNGTFRSSFDVLRDLAGQWEGMNDTQKALVTNAFAGSRQSNIFQTLMEGMSEDGGSLMDEYLGLANNSEGTTQSKYEIAMQSLASSMEQVKTAWDGVVQAFVDNGVITGVLEKITNFLTGIAKAVEDTQGKTEVAISVIVAALAGLTAAIAAMTIAAATGATALAAFAGPIGWVVGIGGALAALSIIGSKYGQNYDSKVNNYEERATTRIEQTTKSQSETNKIISELKSLKDAYDKSDDKNSFESANSDKFNSLLIELNKCIPGVVDEFGNLTLSSENLAAALDKATAASEQKTEQDIKNMFGQGLVEAYKLMGEYFENRTSSTLGETYSAFGRAEDASKVEQTDYNEMIRTRFPAGATERDGLLSQVKSGNFTEFNKMMRAYATANGLSTLNPEDIWEEIITTVWSNADTGTLDFSSMTYQDANGNLVYVGEYVKQQIFKYVSDNLVVDQSGEDIIDSALDMFMAYVSSDMLPDGMKLDDVRSLALKMIQGNGQLYDNGEYNPQSMETSAFANLVLQNLFTPFTNNGTSGFGLLSQYDAQAGEKYAYTLNSENWGFDGTESVTRSDGSQVKSYYKTITDSEGNSHRLYFNRNNGGQEIFYKDEQENIHQITNTNNKEDIPQWLFDDGLVTVNEELATEANNNASETYTTLSAMGYNTKSEYDKGNGYLAMVQKGLRDNNEDASFSTIEDFNAFMDKTKVNDTLLSQVIGGAFDADKSGASLAAFNFASTEAGKTWMQKNSEYLTNTIMNASSTNGINTAGLEPLFNYLEGEGADRSFADLETDENYQDLMQNMKTQLGDDMYTQLANGDITVDQAREYLEGQWLENERSGYSDEQWDILQEKNGYDKEIAELEGKSSRTDEEETHLASLKEQSEDAQSRLSLLFTADQIRKTRKYGDATEDVADTLEKMTKRGAEAADQVSDLTSKMVTFRNQKWAIDKLSTGWDDEAGSALGLDENSYNYMKENNLLDGYLENMGKGIDTSAANYIVNPLIEAINAELASGNDNITADWVMNLESSINNDGLIDSSEMASLISQCKNEQINKFIALAGNGKIATMKITTRQTEDGAGLYVTAEETGEVTSEKNKSGGGGGGGKSAAELLIDKQKKDKTLYEHMVKMVQYQQTKYQNADELGNYGLMIEKEIEVEKKRLPVIQQNIEKLKEQIATVAADSDDWYSLRDAILEAEEEYEEVNNTIDENIKKLEENQQAIYKLRTDLEDTVKEEIENRKQEETDMLSGSVSMQETILAAIKQRYQDEWDQEVHNPRIAGKP